tara:strand:+ start:148 stop:1203 length:1056 start_codon:yes stop_codon:yes gene_type:complete
MLLKIIIILLILVIIFFVGCRINIYLSTNNDYSEYVTVKKNIDINVIIDHLNNKWNLDPENYINDLNGAEKSLVFMHYFDSVSIDKNNEESIQDKCVSTSKEPWCPNNFFYFLDTLPQFNNGTVRKLFKIPVKSVSFLAGNSNMFPYINVLPNVTKNYGMIFDFTFDNKNSTNTGPLCFWPTDAGTLGKTKMGCGSYGIQFQNYGNKLLNTSNNSDEIDKLFDIEALRINKILKTHNYYDPMLVLLDSKRSSLNFKQFILINKKLKDKFKHLHIPDDKFLALNNEVIFNQWHNKKIEETPIVAFFYNTNATEKDINEIKNIKQELLTKTKNDIPIIKFDNKKINSPFSREF